MNRRLLVDPIEHAWRHCNPKTPVPSALSQGAVLSTQDVGLLKLRRNSSAQQDAAPAAQTLSASNCTPGPPQHGM